MAKQTFIVSAGDRSITTTKSGIKSSIDTLLDEGFTSISVKYLGQPITYRPFKVGDVVEVTDNNSYHQFAIGENVSIISGTDDDWLATNGERQWWVSNNDIRLVK